MASHGIPRAAANSSRDVVKEKKKIDEYRDLVELVSAKISAEQYTDEVLQLTTNLLSRNPEYYTIWNYRRRVLQQQFDNLPSPKDDEEQQEGPSLASRQALLDIINDDLDMLVGFLLQYPKCYWIWKYRLWLLEQAEKRLPRELCVKQWQKELGLVGKMLSRDERNFHGWGYRRTVVASLERLTQHDDPAFTMVEDEFAYTTFMISSGLKNFSAWHRRSKLIPVLLEQRKADDAVRRQLLDDELDLAQNALVDPFNQSAWDYHAFLMDTITPGSSVEGTIVKDMSVEERRAYYVREMERAKEMLEVDDDCKLIYEALLKYGMVYTSLSPTASTLDSEELNSWLAKLYELDPLRNGRWADLERRLHPLQGVLR